MTGSTERDLFGLAGRTALVIGGGQGMGRASAEKLATAGAHVVLLDVERDRVAAAAAALRDAGGSAEAIVHDVHDDAALAGAVAGTAERCGGLDVLVDVVGGVGAGAYLPAKELPADLLECEARHNLRHAFVAAQAFARASGSGRGGRSIVVVASISGLNSSPKHAAYGAAKAGLMSLVRTLAQEWGPDGIRVNAIAPGSILTDRNQPSDEVRATIAAHTPLRRLGRQEEIGSVALFLASDLAAFVSGDTVLVDGGLQTNYPFPMY